MKPFCEGYASAKLALGRKHSQKHKERGCAVKDTQPRFHEFFPTSCAQLEKKHNEKLICSVVIYHSNVIPIIANWFPLSYRASKLMVLVGVSKVNSAR